MIADIMKNPHDLTYDEVESMADMFVKKLAEQKMTYNQGWMIIDGHMKVLKEAISHMNHNAGVQKKDDLIVWVLDSKVMPSPNQNPVQPPNPGPKKK